jgi:hypothetical protein
MKQQSICKQDSIKTNGKYDANLPPTFRRASSSVERALFSPPACSSALALRSHRGTDRGHSFSPALTYFLARSTSFRSSRHACAAMSGSLSKSANREMASSRMPNRAVVSVFASSRSSSADFIHTRSHEARSLAFASNARARSSSLDSHSSCRCRCRKPIAPL